MFGFGFASTFFCKLTNIPAYYNLKVVVTCSHQLLESILIPPHKYYRNQYIRCIHLTFLLLIKQKKSFLRITNFWIHHSCSPLSSALQAPIPPLPPSLTLRTECTELCSIDHSAFTRQYISSAASHRPPVSGLPPSPQRQTKRGGD